MKLIAKAADTQKTLDSKNIHFKTFLEIFFETGFQNLFLNGSNNCINFLSVFENHACWNTTYSKIRCNAWTLIRIQFYLRPHFIKKMKKSCVSTALNLSPNSSTSSSIVGLIILHGPHHGAQKSTRTGTVLFITSDSQFVSVTSIAFIAKQSSHPKRISNRSFTSDGASNI